MMVADASLEAEIQTRSSARRSPDNDIIFFTRVNDHGVLRVYKYGFVNAGHHTGVLAKFFNRIVPLFEVFTFKEIVQRGRDHQ